MAGPFKMKNPLLAKSAKSGESVASNFASPARHKKDGSFRGHDHKGMSLMERLGLGDTKIGKDITEFGKGIKEDVIDPTAGFISGAGEQVAGDVSEAIEDIRGEQISGRERRADYKKNKRAGESQYQYNIRKRRESRTVDPIDEESTEEAPIIMKGSPTKQKIGKHGTKAETKTKSAAETKTTRKILKANPKITTLRKELKVAISTGDKNSIKRIREELEKIKFKEEGGH